MDSHEQAKQETEADEEKASSSMALLTSREKCGRQAGPIREPKPTLHGFSQQAMFALSPLYFRMRFGDSCFCGFSDCAWPKLNA